MTIYTRINFLEDKYGCYVKQNTWEILKSIITLAPAEVHLCEDEVDFIIKPNEIRYNTLVCDTDTIMITTDSKGSFSKSTIYRKIGNTSRCKIDLDFASTVSYTVTRSWEGDSEIQLYKDSVPCDILLRTNRQHVFCVAYGLNIKIILETHRRGPYNLESDKSWLFKDSPVYLCEVEIEGDCSNDTCANIVSCLLPHAKINR